MMILRANDIMGDTAAGELPGSMIVLGTNSVLLALPFQFWAG